MKLVLTFLILMASSVAEERATFAVRNCTFGGIGSANVCASLAGGGLPIGPNFQPQIQVFITPPPDVPDFYQLTINYVDDGGQERSAVVLVTATPGPTTLAIVYVEDANALTVSVRPLKISGPQLRMRYRL